MDQQNGKSLYHPQLRKEHYYPVVTAYYFKQWHKFHMEFHSHKELEVMYVIEGACLIETKDESFHLKKGEFVFIDNLVEHRLNVSEPCKMINIEFYFTHTNKMIVSMKHLIEQSQHLQQLIEMEQPYIILKHSDEIDRLLKMIIFESDQQNRDDLVSLMIGQLLIHLARLGVKTKEAQSQMYIVNKYVEETIQYMHYSYEKDIKVQDLADAVNVHPNYLHRIFKQVMNESIIEYLTKLRVRQAKVLLRDTNLSIIEITHKVGMNSSQYFSQVFKKYVGCTPRDYRNKAVEKYR